MFAFKCSQQKCGRARIFFDGHPIPTSPKSLRCSLQSTQKPNGWPFSSSPRNTSGILTWSEEEKRRHSHHKRPTSCTSEPHREVSEGLHEVSSAHNRIQIPQKQRWSPKRMRHHHAQQAGEGQQDRGYRNEHLHVPALLQVHHQEQVPQLRGTQRGQLAASMATFLAKRMGLPPRIPAQGHSQGSLQGYMPFNQPIGRTLTMSTLLQRSKTSTGLGSWSSQLNLWFSFLSVFFKTNHNFFPSVCFKTIIFYRIFSSWTRLYEFTLYPGTFFS